MVLYGLNLGDLSSVDTVVKSLGGSGEASVGYASDPERTDRAVSAKGLTRISAHSPDLPLRLSNQGAEPMVLSYVMDEFVAQTRDGQRLILDKDFLTYPARLDPGAEVTVTVRLPNDVPTSDIHTILATINEGKTRLTLKNPSVIAPPAGASAMTWMPAEVAADSGCQEAQGMGLRLANWCAETR